MQVPKKEENIQTELNLFTLTQKVVVVNFRIFKKFRR